MKHRVISGPDPVTAEYRTRCGLSSLKGTHGDFDKFLGTMSEGEVSCPKCRIKLTAVQKKVLRLMYQAKGTGFYNVSNKFTYSTDRGLRMYGPRATVMQLLGLGLLAYYKMSNTKFILRVPGQQIAKSLPEVKDDF